jgi:hypothetical protein
MNFGQLKRRLQSLINRKDLSDALAGDFITDAVSDMERVLRVGCMEVVLIQKDWDGLKNAVVIPPNFLEGINLFTDTTELTQCDLSTFLGMKDQGGIPTHYVKVADRWLLKPTPRANLDVYLHFYAQSQPLATDTDESVWTQSALNAVVYQAATLAADHFQMEDVYARRFKDRASDYVQAIQEQDLDEKWSGRIAVPPPADVGEY